MSISGTFGPSAIWCQDQKNCFSTEPLSGVDVFYGEFLEAKEFVVREKPEIEKQVASELNNLWDLPD